MTPLTFFLFLAATLALDVGITTYALKHPQFKEADPFTAFFIGKLGLIPGQIAPKAGVYAALYGAGKLWPHHASDCATVAFFMAIGFVVLAVWNLYVLHKGGAL